MNMNRYLSHGLAALAITLVAGCGGGSDSAPASAPGSKVATSISYTDPSGSGWRLVKQESSTSTRVVLGLVGPSGTTSRGVGFNIGAGYGVHFATFTDGNYAKDTGVFQLKGSNPNFEPYAGTDADPVLFASRLKGDKLLTTGIFQKDRSYSAKPLAAPVVQIAIELDQLTRLTQGAQVSLTVLKARMVPADIGGMDFQLDMETLAKAKMQDITVEVGRLTAQ
jgi:hypothetical protein